MNINQLKESKFLKKEDCGPGILVTIQEVKQHAVNLESEPEELKWCIHFAEVEKPLVLNSVNAQLIAQITKSEETDNWIGDKVVLYTDPTVSFGGKVMGGIRVRAPRNQPKPVPAQPNPAPAPAPQPDPAVPYEPGASDDNCPF